MSYTKEELMNLPPEEMKKLEYPILSNSDEQTNMDKWTRVGVKHAHGFVEHAAGAVNLLLKRNKNL